MPEKKIQTFETKCMGKLLHISNLENESNNWVTRKINFLVGPQEPLLTTVKRRKLAWLEYVVRHDSLQRIILQGTFEDGRSRGRQRKCWLDNVKEWTSLPGPEPYSQHPSAQRAGGRFLLNPPPDDPDCSGSDPTWPNDFALHSSWHTREGDVPRDRYSLFDVTAGFDGSHWYGGTQLMSRWCVACFIPTLVFATISLAKQQQQQNSTVGRSLTKLQAWKKGFWRKPRKTPSVKDASYPVRTKWNAKYITRESVLQRQFCKNAFEMFLLHTW